MKPFEPNGKARIATKKYWRGLAERFGHDPEEETERVAKARITKQLVRTSYERFDRHTGRDLSRFSSHVKSRRLVGYRLAGQEWVTVQRETP